MDRDSPCLALTDSGIMATSAQRRKDPGKSLPACLTHKRNPAPRVNLLSFFKPAPVSQRVVRSLSAGRGSLWGILEPGHYLLPKYYTLCRL